MEDIFSVIVFSIPGIMTYYFIQLLGLTLGTKDQSSEKLALSIIFWVPVTFITMLFYQLVALLSHIEFLHTSTDIPLLKKNWHLFNNLSDFQILMNSYWFIIYFFIISLLVSYVFANYVAILSLEKLKELVNNNRKKKKIPLLSSKPSVWEEVFTGNDIQIVGIKSLGNGTETVYGEIKNISRSINEERDISLRNCFYWKSILETYNVSVVETFINTQTSTVVEIYDLEQIEEAETLYNSHQD